VGAQMIPELLSVFRREHPSIQFHLSQNTTHVLLDQLEQGEIDFCISALRPEQPDIEWTPLMSEEIFLVVPSIHHLATQDVIALSELKEEPFISLKFGTHLREVSDRFCLQAGFTLQPAFEVDELSMVRGLVAAGLGMAFIPALALRNITGLGIVPLHVTDIPCQRTIGLTQIKERSLTGAARVFRDFVIAYFAQHEASA
ncbi:MAG TPA: LysR substrate-binding domain-containing protein, partial [Ktedonobacteraceae bacterium]